MNSSFSHLLLHLFSLFPCVKQVCLPSSYPGNSTCSVSLKSIPSSQSLLSLSQLSVNERHVKPVLGYEGEQHGSPFLGGWRTWVPSNSQQKYFEQGSDVHFGKITLTASRGRWERVKTSRQEANQEALAVYQSDELGFSNYNRLPSAPLITVYSWSPK